MEILESLKEVFGWGTPEPIIENTQSTIEERAESLLKEVSVASMSTSLSDQLQQLNANNHVSVSALSSIYTKVHQSRTGIIRAVADIRPFYIADIIISQYVDDALAPDTTTGDIVSVSSANPVVEKEIRRLEHKFNFDTICYDVAPELVAYGEYTLKTVIKEGEGLDDLLDNVDQDTVIALPSHGDIDGYLVKQYSRGGILNSFKVVPPKEYVKFMLSGQRVRVALNKEFQEYNASIKAKMANLPSYIRIGKSLIYPAIAKIKELQLLEEIVPASKLAKLSQGTIVGIQVPAGYDPKKATQLVQSVENMINSKTGLDKSQKRITLENIWSASGKIKAIPVFGDKGNLQKFDYKSDEPEDLLSNIIDIRKTICSSVGIPYELIFGTEVETSKGTVLKRYARYLRRLKNLQYALAEGIRQIIYVHLVNKGISFSENDVNIEFRNKLVDIDSLDKLEFVDATIGTLKNLSEFINMLKPLDKSGRVDMDALMEYIGDTLHVVGVENIVTHGEGDEDHVDHRDEMKDKMADIMQLNRTKEKPSEEETEPTVSDEESSPFGGAEEPTAPTGEPESPAPEAPIPPPTTTPTP